MLLFVVEGDYNITNQPAVIPVGVSQTCFQLVTIDDIIVETDEGFTLVVEASNSNDMVVGNATFFISDNDSMIGYVRICMIVC